MSVCRKSKITCGIIILSLFWEVIKSLRIPIFGLAGHYYLKFVYYLKNPLFLHSFFSVANIVTAEILFKRKAKITSISP